MSSVQPVLQTSSKIEFIIPAVSVSPCGLLLNLKLHSVIEPSVAKSLQSCPTLCDPIVGSPAGSPVPGILQTRTMEWVALSSPMCESEVAQSCPTPSNPMDCTLPGSSVHGIFQARVLEWVAIAFSDI